LKLQQGNDGYIILNPFDIEDLGVKNGSLLTIIDETSSNIAVLKSFISENVPRDVAFGDPNILENLGFQESGIVEINEFDGIVDLAQDIEVEFTSLDQDPKEMFLPKNQTRLVSFLEKYFYTEITELFWPEKNMNLRIKIKKPKNFQERIYKIKLHDVNMKLRPETHSMPFNAILIIDKSRSMTRWDVKLQGAEAALEELSQKILGTTNYGDNTTQYPNLAKWFSELRSALSSKKSGYDYLRNSQKDIRIGARRIDSVLFSTLLFFQLKISRGYGEKCAFVLYSDEAKVIQINNKDYIEATEINPRICDELIRKVKDRSILRYGNTNISSAIRYCKRIALEYKKINNNPLMILLLTDGSPHPPHLDSPGMVRQTVLELNKFLDDQGIPFVIYTIGIGDDRKQIEKLLEQAAI